MVKEDDLLDSWALVFGNKDVRELGKEKSEWFKKIYMALDNDEPGFLEFIFSAEFRYASILAKEELIPTTSLLVIKMRKKHKEAREKRILELFNEDFFDDYCKETFHIIKGDINYGNY